MLTNIKRMKGYRLGALDGEIGSVKDFYFDDESWTVRYLVADTGRWLPARKVLISPFALRHVREHDKVIDVALTKKQIEESPSIDADKLVSRQFEAEYYKYYGWPLYWEGPGLWGPFAVPAHYGDGGGSAQRSEVLRDQNADPHLRSAEEMIGYHIQTRDGEVGHVEDFLVEDETWAIRYLVADTRNWWPGKKVLIAPPWIEKVSWERSKVFVDLLRETIKGAPGYLPDEGIDREYETGLYDYYQREVYWDRERHAELAHSR